VDGVGADLGGGLHRDGTDLLGDCGCGDGDADTSLLEYFRRGEDGDLCLGGVGESGVSLSSSDAVETNSHDLWLSSPSAPARKLQARACAMSSSVAGVPSIRH